MKQSVIADKNKHGDERRFWVEGYAAYTPSFREEVITPIQNKVGEFVTTPLIRNIVGQRKKSFPPLLRPHPPSPARDDLLTETLQRSRRFYARPRALVDDAPMRLDNLLLVSTTSCK